MDDSIDIVDSIAPKGIRRYRRDSGALYLMTLVAISVGCLMVIDRAAFVTNDLPTAYATSIILGVVLLAGVKVSLSFEQLAYKGLLTTMFLVGFGELMWLAVIDAQLGQDGGILLTTMATSLGLFAAFWAARKHRERQVRRTTTRGDPPSHIRVLEP